MGCGSAKLFQCQPTASQPERGARSAHAKKLSDSTVQSKRSGSGLAQQSGCLVMGRYRYSGRQTDVVGQGSFSICYKAVDTKTGEQVALKMYKDKASRRFGNIDKSTLDKFERQVAVLQSLQEPFAPPCDPSLWSDELDSVNPSDLFVRLIDYSKDAKGKPGPDVEDGNLYVITELAQYSLKTFLKMQRSAFNPLPKDYVQTITKEIILIVAGLHAKGYVHLDLKPENLMRFGGGRLKLIDVDGCVPVGADVSINDSTVSFSPCYCSPDWAQFVYDGDSITISPSLDVWSVGMTLCELIGQEPVLKPKYNSIAKQSRSRTETTRLYMKWLSSIKSVPLPQGTDDGMNDLLSQWLLVPDAPNRKSCAESLSSPYLMDCDEMVRLPTLLTSSDISL